MSAKAKEGSNDDSSSASEIKEVPKEVLSRVININGRRVLASTKMPEDFNDVDCISAYLTFNQVENRLDSRFGFTPHGLDFHRVSDIIDVPRPHEWLRLLSCSACGFLVTDEYLLCVKEGHITCIDCKRKKPGLKCKFRLSFAQESSLNDESFGDVGYQMYDLTTQTLKTSKVKDKDDEEELEEEEEDQEEEEKDEETEEEFVEPENDQSAECNGITSSALGMAKEEAPSKRNANSDGWHKVLKAFGLPLPPAKSQENASPSMSQKSASQSQLGDVCGSELRERPHAFIENLLANIKLICPHWKQGCNAIVPAKKMHAHYSGECPYGKTARNDSITLAFALASR